MNLLEELKLQKTDDRWLNELMLKVPLPCIIDVHFIMSEFYDSTFDFDASFSFKPWLLKESLKISNDHLNRRL